MGGRTGRSSLRDGCCGSGCPAKNSFPCCVKKGMVDMIYKKIYLCYNIYVYSGCKCSEYDMVFQQNIQAELLPVSK